MIRYIIYLSLLCARVIFAGEALKWDKLRSFASISLVTESVRMEYFFTNVGSSPIRIIKAWPDCECTLASWPHDPVKPGEAGEIEISIDTKDETGDFKKVVRIVTDEASHPSYNLTNSISIPRILSVWPERLSFDRKSPVTQYVTLSNLLDTPIGIHSVIYDSPKGMNLHIQEVDGGRKFLLDIKPSASDDPYNIRISVVVRGKDLPFTKSIRLIGSVK